MCTLMTTPLLSSVDPLRVNAPVAIPASTSAVTPSYFTLTTLFLSVAISPANPVILCSTCPVTGVTILYIGETGRSLRSHFSEHLHSICN